MLGRRFRVGGAVLLLAACERSSRDVDGSLDGLALDLLVSDAPSDVGAPPPDAARPDLPGDAAGGAFDMSPEAVVCLADSDADGGDTPAVPTPSAIVGDASCVPLPETFVFPKLPALSGYQRCASFDVAGAVDVAVSPDGSLAAIVGGDGVVRVVKIATRTVVAVLSLPTASIDRAAFSPSGDALITLARGERQVTRWNTSTWAAAWSALLPGRRYLNHKDYPGGIAFPPDAGALAVSPGAADVFLLDPMTGQVRAQRPAPGMRAVTLGLAYGWGGRRLVLAESVLGGHCAPHPIDGVVSILDPSTLATTGQVASMSDYSCVDCGELDMRVSPVDDLVLTAGTSKHPNIQAFRLSDGGSVTVPAALDGPTLPLAFTPDGSAALLRTGTTLIMVGVAAGNFIASAAVSGIDTYGPRPVAFSADGRRLMLGGKGQALLRLWDVGTVAASVVCTALDNPDPREIAPVAMPENGALIAMQWGAATLVARKSDGARLATLDGPLFAYGLRFSPDGALLWSDGKFGNLDTSYPGTRVFDVSNWWEVLLSSDSMISVGAFAEDRVFFGNAANDSLVIGDLDPLHAWTDVRPQPWDGYVVGNSSGCVVSATAGGLRRWSWQSQREPAPCDGTPFAPIGLLSPDGVFVASNGAFVATDAPLSPIVLWRVSPGTSPFRQFMSRDEGPIATAERVLAVSRNAERVVIAESPRGPCYAGPLFETRVHDPSSCAVLGRLPPEPSAVSADGLNVAYGGQLWCWR